MNTVKPDLVERGSLPRTHVSRPRLLQMLDMATQGRLTLVCANAGYGKTTMVTEYIQTAGVRAEWYHLTKADRDVARLAVGLENALRRLGKGHQSRGGSRSQARYGGAASVSLLVNRLLRQASKLGPEQALVVLEDYQNVGTSSDADSLLGALIDEGPPHLRFVVLSRSVPRFPMGKLRAMQELHTLGEDELAFTMEETARFLRGQNPQGLPDTAISLVLERTEGWAAGIAMVSQSLRYGRQDKVMEVLSQPEASAWLVYDYLAEEVFDKLEPAIQQFLLRTSVLSRVSVRACNCLLGVPSSQAALLQIQDRGLFTASIDPARRTFRYHQLFLEFLRQKLQQVEPQETISALQLKAAESCRQEGEWEDCVQHYLKAGEPGKAAEVVESIGVRYIFSGRSQTVEYWMNVLPKELTTTRPWLLALRGRLSHMSLRRGEAIALLDRALRLFQTQGDAEGQAWAAGEMAYIWHRTGQLKQSVAGFASALATPYIGSELKSQLLVMQSMSYRDAGMLEAAVRACRSSLEELAAVEDQAARSWGQSRAGRNLAYALSEMGNLEEALRVARKVYADCVSQQAGEYEESWNAAQLGAILWARGEFDESVQLLNRALFLSGWYTKHQQHLIGLRLGNSLRDLGRFTEAERAYELSPGAAELERLFLSIRAGKTPPVSSAHGLYLRFKDSEEIADRSIAEMVLAIVLREHGQTEEALAHAQEGVHLLRTRGYRLRLCSALLHLARIQSDLSEAAESHQSLAEALELASSGDYYHFYWWDPELVRWACQRALADGILVEYATRLAARRLGLDGANLFCEPFQDRSLGVHGRIHTIPPSSQGRSPGQSQVEVLEGCNDPMVRDALLRAMNEGLMSSEAIRVLRFQRGLSWREIEILLEYYLRPATSPLGTASRLRKECAQRLNISENTVRCHVNNLRSKLSLPPWVSGNEVSDWMRQENLMPTSDQP